MRPHRGSMAPPRDARRPLSHRTPGALMRRTYELQLSWLLVLELLLPDALVPSHDPELPLLVCPPPPPPQRLTPRSVNPGAMRRSSFASSRFRCFIRYHLPPVARKCGPCGRPQQSGGPINAREESGGWAVGPNLEADRRRVGGRRLPSKHRVSTPPASVVHPPRNGGDIRAERRGVAGPGRLRPCAGDPTRDFHASGAAHGEERGEASRQRRRTRARRRQSAPPPLGR